MEDKLVRKVAEWADRKRVLLPDTAVVAGVSGGADSVCLLHVLLQLARQRSFSVFAVHVNHMLRGDESDRDEEFVRDMCAEWKVPLHVLREDVGAYAAKEGYSVEEAGRIIRYECFHKIMGERGAQYIAVAHHQDDQAETVFLHLLRGSGLDGLCGMDDISGFVIRPFLDVEKAEIEEYIERNGLRHRFDSSNQDNSYVRNAIRNEIFPLTEERTRFPVLASLNRTARLLKADKEFLSEMAQQLFHTMVRRTEENKVILDRIKFNTLHPSMAGRIIRLAWKELTGSAMGLEEKHVATVGKLSYTEGSGKRVNLPEGIHVVVEYDKLVFMRMQTRHAAAQFCFRLSVPSVIDLPDGSVRFISCLYTAEEYQKKFGSLEKAKEESLTQIFDYDKINRGINKTVTGLDSVVPPDREENRVSEPAKDRASLQEDTEGRQLHEFTPMTIRNRRPGDTFFPYRSPGSKKLKEFFIDEKILRDERDDIPLLAVDQNIIWVVGLRTSELYRISENTGKVLHIQAVPLNK